MTEVDKILGMSEAAKRINKAKCSNKVLIDFSTHSKIKNDMITKVVQSSLCQKMRKLGIPEEEIQKTSNTEVPMSLISKTLRNNKNFRKSIYETFLNPGETNLEYLQSMKRDDNELEVENNELDELIAKKIETPHPPILSPKKLQKQP